MSKDKPSITESLEYSLEAGLDRVVAELQATRAGVKLRGVEPRALLVGSSTRVSTSAGRLMGWLVAETTGTATAKIRLHDGADANADLVGTITLAAGESARDFLGPQGIGLTYGLFVELVSGAVEGTLLLGGR